MLTQKILKGRLRFIVDYFDYDEKVELLLNYGADMHARDNSGKNPYYYLDYNLSEKVKEIFRKNSAI